MKLNRTKNTIRNIIFGLITKVYNLLMPFIIRTVIIHYLGMNYVGLNSLFTSVLSVLNLAELGVGSALAFSMYKPIAEDDNEKICALMRLYKIYYRIIGIVILLIGLSLVPFLPKLIKSDLPTDVNLYVLYFLNLGTTVLSYWLFAYKNCLLNVHQRNDIGDKIGYFVNTIKYAVQILTLVFLKNYYAFLIVALLSGVISNIVTAVIVDKKYPAYRAGGKLEANEIKKINTRVRDLFTSKVGSVVIDSADTIVISSFLGLNALALYQNYFYIINTVAGFVTIITSSAFAGIGNSLVTETEEKNYNLLEKLSFIFYWINSICVCCFASLYQPFMKLWVGESNLLPYSMVILFCVYFYIKQFNLLFNVFKDAAGIWHKDRFRPLITALANLTVNLLLVKHFELYGVLLSTVVTMLFIGMPWLFSNLFSTIFKSTNPRNYILMLLRYSLLLIIISIANTLICNYFISFNSLILTIAVRLIISFLIPNAILIIFFKNNPNFKQLLQLVFDFLHIKNHK
ncbi:MAG: lipopolysaccharide biosynthesis protein [Eubacterium sp.]